MSDFKKWWIRNADKVNEAITPLRWAEMAWNAALAAKLPCGHPVGCIVPTDLHHDASGATVKDFPVCGWCESLRKLESTYKDDVEALVKLEAALDDVSGDLAQVLKDSAKLEAELTEANLKLAEPRWVRTEKLAEVEAERDTLKHEMALASEHWQETKAQIERLEAERDLELESRKRFQEGYGAMKRELYASSEQIKKLESERDALRKSVASFEKEEDRLEGMIMDLQDKRAKCSAERDALMMMAERYFIALVQVSEKPCVEVTTKDLRKIAEAALKEKP
jgi:chromosome segregation ATPase